MAVAEDKKFTRIQYGSEEYTGVLVGRFKRVISPQEVHKLATYHCTIKEICNFYGVDRKALMYHFEDLISAGYEATRQTIRSKQLELALDGKGNPTMLIWLGKNMLNQSDNGSTFSENEDEDEAVFTVSRPQKPAEEAIDES